MHYRIMPQLMPRFDSNDTMVGSLDRFGGVLGAFFLFDRSNVAFLE